MKSVLVIMFAALLALPPLAEAQQKGKARGPQRVPPKGITVPSTTRATLVAGLGKLGKEIQSLQTDLESKPEMLSLLPDIQIYFNAVHYALAHEIFYRSNDFPFAEALLQHGFTRSRELRAGTPTWTTATGLVVRGYTSKIDGSVQPYGLVVPPAWQPGATNKFRLDFWFHGRDDRLSELKFINDRQAREGQLMPPDTFVVHPYGRYCNANKFAGEVDTFEVLEHVSKSYPIDQQRIAMRGFSMGGAAVWHLAAHHAGLWRAAQPGAGFAETAQFARLYEREPKPAPYEEKLWRLYDATEYAANLYHVKTIAYYGELDGQKQAAEVMEKAMAAENLSLETITAPNTRHQISPEARDKIAERMDSIMAFGRNPAPRNVKFTTFTLRYNKMLWVTIDEMDQHWERARVNASVVGKGIKATAENIAALTFDMPAGTAPFEAGATPSITINDSTVTGPAVGADKSWKVQLRTAGGGWSVVPFAGATDLRKRHGLQGPIDDAFMDSFMMVRPTGRAASAGLANWVTTEMNEAIMDWWLQFRGQPRIKDDSAITDEDIAKHNLILWGDPTSNKIYAKIADKLPVQWDTKGIQMDGQTFTPDKHVPVFIFPNPLNPKRYVVLNTGFTFAESGMSNNANQVPRLPDFAVIDVTVPRATRMSAGVVHAGFFDERWQFKR